MINIQGCRFNKKQLAIGKKVELEHTNSPRVAERIAKQHLCEYKNYYTGLLALERKLAKR